MTDEKTLHEKKQNVLHRKSVNPFYSLSPALKNKVLGSTNIPYFSHAGY